MPQKKRKDKVPETKSKEPKFIRFSKVQRGFLAEISRRNQRDWNEALESVYDELGIMEKILKSPPGTYNMRQDLSGLDVQPLPPPPPVVEKKPEEKKAPENKTKSQEELLPQNISKEKGEKDN